MYRTNIQIVEAPVTTPLGLKAPRLLPDQAGSSLVHEPKYSEPHCDRG